MAPKKRSAQTGYHTYERDRQQKQTARSRAAARSRTAEANARSRPDQGRQPQKTPRLGEGVYLRQVTLPEQRQTNGVEESRQRNRNSHMTTQREQSKRESVRRKTGRQTRPQETVRRQESVRQRQENIKYKKKRSGPKKKKRKIPVKWILGMIGVILAAALLGYLILLLFEVKKIEVKGTVYTSEQEVLDWVQEDKYSSNSLYILWKYGSKETKQLPPIERTTVSLKSPWEVVVTVKEKTFEGCMDYDGGYLYFDESGTACLKSTEYIEGVPYIEGIELEKEKVKIGKSIPVKEKKIFEEISEITQVLNEKELTPDKIACEEENLILYFGNVRIQLGSGNFADKLSQVPPILAKLQEQYADQPGVLHLENYTSSDASVRFVPDSAAPPSGTESGDQTNQPEDTGTAEQTALPEEAGGVEQTIPTEVSGT